MAIILPANTLSAGGFSVDNSCRLDGGDGAYMHKTLGTPTSTKICTISFWWKQTAIFGQGDAPILSAKTDSNNRHIIYWSADSNEGGLFKIWGKTGGSVNFTLSTTQVFRDPAAWQHHVIAIDTNQSVATNRVKWYKDGTQITSFSETTYPGEDALLEFSKASSVAYVGAYATSGGVDVFGGANLLSEFVFIDGLQLTPTSFGEYDEDSPTIWKPKDVSGLTFGNNGFYLDFEDSANLGNDANGGTDLTEVNLAAADQATDTPTNNFCTLNPLTKWGGWSSSTGAVVLTQGNCHLNEATHASVVGTIATTNMKFYYEVKINAADFSLGVMGSQPEATSGQSYNDPTAYGYYPSGYKFTAGSWSSDSTFSGTGIYMFAVDPTNNKLWVGKDGTWNGDPSAGSGNMITLGTHEYMPYVHSSGTAGDNSADCNFGGCSAFTVSSANQDANGYGNFEYAVPSGFYALCTKNLAEYG